jgi:hypothetical protein
VYITIDGEAKVIVDEKEVSKLAAGWYPLYLFYTSSSS